MLPIFDPAKALEFMLISCFCDESGKLRDHSVTAFATVAGTDVEFSECEREWKRKLRGAGIKCLTMKEALNHSRPLSEKEPALGLTNRIDALMPFVECIRRNLEFVAGVGVDSQSFNASASHLREILGKTPHLMAFTVTLMEVLKHVEATDNLSVIVDDEEQLASGMFSLYRAVKNSYIDVRQQLSAITFADDEVFVSVQTADMVSSLIRREADRQFHGQANDYESLYEALCAPRSSDRLDGANVLFVGSEQFAGLAEEFANLKSKYPDGGLRLRDLR